NAGNTIISKKGATEYGPSFAISNLISTIINDTHKVLTVSTYLNGEIAGVSGVSLGVPVVLSKKGIAMVVPIHMNDYEQKKFREAAQVVRQTTEEVKNPSTRSASPILSTKALDFFIARIPSRGWAIP
ncbi:MAG: hypothetical protein UHY90_06010, partial [Treponema sp.]|nr:hypothetical protein [Treponema sp.]